MFVYLCIRFQVSKWYRVFFSCLHISPEKVNSQYIFRACSEGSFCGFFLNTFLFPKKTSAVTSWSTADIKTDLQSLKEKALTLQYEIMLRDS